MLLSKIGTKANMLEPTIFIIYNGRFIRQLSKLEKRRNVMTAYTVKTFN